MRASSRLEGIIVPLVTPLLDRETLDRAGLERLVSHVLAGGVHGLFLLGTTGEGPSLGRRLQRECLAAAAELVDGNVPLVVNVSGASLADSLELAQVAADVGARGVAATPPFYFRVVQEALLEYAWQLASDSPLPLFLYNIPQQTGLQFDVGTVARLLEHENIVGVKDSSGDVAQFEQLQRIFAGHPGKSLLAGSEAMLGDAVAGGAQGGVCGGANLFPRLYVELYRCAAQGCGEKAALLGTAVDQVGRHVYQLQDGQWSFIESIKYVLSLLRICGEFVLPPLRQLSESNKNLLKSRLVTLSQQSSGFITAELVDYGFTVSVGHS